MNKLVSRLLSLAAAVLVLAGTLAALPVFAADGPTASLYFVLLDGNTRTSIQPTEKLQEIKIHIDNYPQDPSTLTVSDLFITRLEFDYDKTKITLEGLKDGDSSFDISIPTVNYNGNNSSETRVDFKIGETSFKIPIEFLDNNDGDSPLTIRSVRFSNFDSSKVSVVRKNDIVNLTFSVRDENLSLSELEALSSEEREEFSAALTNNIFSYTRSTDFTFNKENSSESHIQYTITFEQVRYNGSDNAFGVTITYPQSLGLGKKTSSLYIDTGDILRVDNSYNRDTSDDEEDSGSGSGSSTRVPPPTPTIIISEYDYGGGNVSAADSFTLWMRFANTSDRLPIDNIVAKITVPEAFTLTSSSNTFYIDRLSRESSVTREIQLTVKPDAEPVSQVVKVDFTFETVINRERRSLNASQEIAIPVSQLDRFSMNPVEVPAEIYVGDSNSFEVTFINRGKTPVYNVTAEVTGNLAQPGQRQFIGNVASGTEDSVDFLLSANEGGPITGEVIITYEDANMNVKELREPFSTNAIAMEVPEFDPNMVPDDIPMEEPPAWYEQVPVWGWVGGGVVVLILLSFISKLIRAHKEKKLLEDDDEDF